MMTTALSCATWVAEADEAGEALCSGPAVGGGDEGGGVVGGGVVGGVVAGGDGEADCVGVCVGVGVAVG
jgi:hypothetical protein